MKDKTKRRPRQEPTLVDAGGPVVSEAAPSSEAAASPEFGLGSSASDAFAPPQTGAPALPEAVFRSEEFADDRRLVSDPIGPVQPASAEPLPDDDIWPPTGLQPGPLEPASVDREIHAGPLEASQSGDIHPGPLPFAPDSDIHVGPLEPAPSGDIHVGPLESSARAEAQDLPHGDVHILAEDRTVPAASPAPVIVRRKKGWREQRWERRRRRIFFEEALAWVLVPIILVGCYLGLKGVLSALGTTPTALIQGIQTAISSRS